ncbi:helix-turn-helix domain-containing protein [Clostridium beijerinckii]|uniref:helix-turn-helix domain-containing protein n=1 Tax=Clostridium beijerinckii TaxID=1520 RepID=UPI000688A986|nr:helix-turn-helix transcriptional regulator [Clostridium beijerinckii]
MNISSKILKKLRNSRNMTSEELAIDINKKFNTDISGKNIDRWENDKLELKYENLKLMASYYNVTTDFLLGFDLDEFSHIIDLRNDLEITQVMKELEEKYKTLVKKQIVL